MISAPALVIVDGHERARLALAQRLQRIPGARVLAAVGDVRDAARLIEEQAPDLVLYEPRTVREDPLAALQLLRHAGRPVVVWTSSLMPGEAEAFLHAGASAVLLKESNLTHLIEILRRLAALRGGPRRDAVGMALESPVDASADDALQGTLPVRRLSRRCRP